MLNQRQILKKGLVALLIIIIVMIAIFMKIFLHPSQEPDYCQEISKQLSDLDLDQYKYSGVIEKSDGSILFEFYLPENKYIYYMDNNGFTSEDDIYAIKNQVELYLNKHPNSILKKKLITVMVRLMPEEAIYIRNYDDKICSVEDKLSYYDGICIENISSIILFKDARTLDIGTVYFDNIEVFEYFEYIQHLELYSKNLSPQQEKYLKKALPDCSIICNGKVIN